MGARGREEALQSRIRAGGSGKHHHQCVQDTQEEPEDCGQGGPHREPSRPRLWGWRGRGDAGVAEGQASNSVVTVTASEEKQLRH